MHDIGIAFGGGYRYTEFGALSRHKRTLLYKNSIPEFWPYLILYTYMYIMCALHVQWWNQIISKQHVLTFISSEVVVRSEFPRLDLPQPLQLGQGACHDVSAPRWAKPLRQALRLRNGTVETVETIETVEARHLALCPKALSRSTSWDTYVKSWQIRIQNAKIHVK